MSALTYGELFAGYGGLGMGVQSVLGGSMSWCAEFDKAPSAILEHRWPDVPNYGDVTKVDWRDVPPVDVITGGSPCQDLSHAGKRLGMKAGTRSGLWASMCDAVDIIRPRLVVWENVRGALSAEANSALEPCAGCLGGAGDREPVLRALGRVLGDLAELGYDAAWYGLRAADVGAPHGRFRVFIFAWPAADAEHDGRAAYALGRGAGAGSSEGRVLEPQGPPAHPWRVGDGEGGAAADADVDGLGLLGRLDPLGRDSHGRGRSDGPGATGESEARGLTLLPTPVVSDANGAGAHGDGGADLRTAVSLLPTPRATDGTKGGPNQRGSSGDLMLPSAVQLLPTPSVADVEGGRKHRSGERSDELLLNGIAHHDRWGDYAAAIARWEQVIGRPAPAPTEPGPKGSPRLSSAFVEWLMGLPEGHVTDVPGLTRNNQLKALGNGVVPQQAAAATAAWVNDFARSAA